MIWHRLFFPRIDAAEKWKKKKKKIKRRRKKRRGRRWRKIAEKEEDPTGKETNRVTVKEEREIYSDTSDGWVRMGGWQRGGEGVCSRAKGGSRPFPLSRSKISQFFLPSMKFIQVETTGISIAWARAPPPTSNLPPLPPPSYLLFSPRSRWISRWIKN